MCERMLVVLDGSKQAEAILGRAAILAAKNGAEVILLTVLPTPTAVIEDGRVVATLDQEVERMEGTVLPYLKMWKNRLEKSGVKARVVVAFGDPAKQISDYAEMNQVGLIVMTATARKGLRGLIQRTLADKVLRSVTAPVLLLNAA